MDVNKRNLHYFESGSMRALFETMDEWQRVNRKRFLSVSIHRDSERFCCIATTNPTEVVIVDGAGIAGASRVNARGGLQVFIPAEDWAGS